MGFAQLLSNKVQVNGTFQITIELVEILNA